MEGMRVTPNDIRKSWEVTIQFLHNLKQKSHKCNLQNFGTAYLTRFAVIQESR